MIKAFRDVNIKIVLIHNLLLPAAADAFVTFWNENNAVLFSSFEKAWKIDFLFSCGNFAANENGNARNKKIFAIEVIAIETLCVLCRMHINFIAFSYDFIFLFHYCRIAVIDIFSFFNIPYYFGNCINRKGW